MFRKKHPLAFPSKSIEMLRFPQTFRECLAVNKYTISGKLTYSLILVTSF